ncbi:MAG: hypothetical protein AMXMBFR84_26870 [Candidatus Hydrogenedentota bacterium]
MSTVLVVDDNAQNLYLLETLLEANGHRVATASNGASALDLARRQPPDVIVSDILMPGMDGFTLCREWKSDGRLKRIPFVFYTATYTDPKDEEFALRLGADRFLTKPQEAGVMLRVIADVLIQGTGRDASAGDLQSDETSAVKEYNEALIRKLEDKMIDVDEVNRKLEQEIAERKKAEEALRRSEQELQTRNKIAEVFLTVTDDRMYVRVLEILLEALGSRLGAFGYIDENGSLIVPGMHREIGHPFQMPEREYVFPAESWGDTIWARAIREKRTVIENEPLACSLDPNAVLDRAMASPLIHQGEVVGLIEVANRTEPYEPDDARLLESISKSVAPILNARLNSEREERQRIALETQLRQSQKMEAIGQLAGGIAHDFNNILQAILGYSRLALEKAESGSELHGDLTQVIKGADHAASLTRQLLAFSRQQILERKDINVNALVESLIKLLRRTLGAAIHIEFKSGENLSTVHADPGQIEQVILNICINARDAMPSGGDLLLETSNVTLSRDFCDAHPWAQPGSYVLLTMSDNGTGMDEETQKRIFDPFFTTKDAGKGTGLGLATVYGIVRQHDGLVHVYSEVGKGTAFKIYLPAVLRSASHAKRAQDETVAGGHETVLFAEDDEALRRLGVRILESAGYTVLSASNGQEAVEVFNAHVDSIAIAVLDVVMPKMGGRVVYDSIRSVNPAVRVLFSSGYSGGVGGLRHELRESAPLLQKPYEPKALLRKVREILDAPDTA